MIPQTFSNPFFDFLGCEQMTKDLRKCLNCGRYTLKKDKCPVCGGPLKVPYPPSFSPIDKYLTYRLKMKKESGMYKKESGMYNNLKK